MRLVAGGRTRLADIAVSGLPGWMTVNTADGRGTVRLAVWAPAGVEVFVRPPMPVGPLESTWCPPGDRDQQGGWWFDGGDASSTFESAVTRRSSSQASSRERRNFGEDWWDLEEAPQGTSEGEDASQSPEGSGYTAWETGMDQDRVSPGSPGGASLQKDSWETERKQKKRGRSQDTSSINSF